MTTLCGQRKGAFIQPFSDEDLQGFYRFPENQFLEIKIKGSKKERAYKELCCYMGSCEYVASLNLNENMNSKIKVDHLTRLKCNFVEGTVFDENGLLHWIPKSLSYANCEQPDAHKFIAEALELHANMAGIIDVDKYVQYLKKGFPEEDAPEENGGKTDE